MILIKSHYRKLKKSGNLLAALIPKNMNLMNLRSIIFKTLSPRLKLISNRSKRQFEIKIEFELLKNFPEGKLKTQMMKKSRRNGIKQK